MWRLNFFFYSDFFFYILRGDGARMRSKLGKGNNEWGLLARDIIKIIRMHVLKASVFPRGAATLLAISILLLSVGVRECQDQDLEV